MKSIFTITLTLLLTFFSNHISAQCNDTLLYDDFSDASSWTKSGTGNVSVTGEKATFAQTNDRLISRVYKPIGDVLDNDYWKAECHLSITSENTSVYGYHLMVMGLTKGASDFGIDASGRETTQDGIAVMLNSDNAADGNFGKAAFYLQIKKGSTRGQSNTGIYAKSGVTDYYIRLERIDGSNMKLSVFTNKEMTEELGTALSLSVESTITDLNTIQHGVIETEIVERRISATIDDDYICNFNPDKVSVQSTFLDLGFTVFPNPTRSKFTIQNLKPTKSLSLIILSIDGRVMKTVPTEEISEGSIDISDLSSGTYFLKMNTGEGIAVQKIIKR